MPEHMQDKLSSCLKRLSAAPSPSVATLADVKKRASVALVVRVSPDYSHWPAGQDNSKVTDLNTFFQQDWVQHGTAEVLFIKRAARKGDRWTSHVALPGGKRDPEDEDDLAAAIRETWEEVGLDISLSNPHVIQAGNLPQRVVTTHWGRVPLLVLCPYVFLLTSHGTPPLRLQPTEVASCHWVPLSELLNPAHRTRVEEDVSSRLANQETGIRRWMLSAMVGKMVFSAIHLKPSESVKCSQIQTLENTLPASARFLSNLDRILPGSPSYEIEPPLLLWGLTLGVVTDLLDLLPPYDALAQWDYPTFTPLDVRLAIWIATYNFKARKAQEIKNLRSSQPTEVQVADGKDSLETWQSDQMREAGMHGLCTGVSESAEATRLKAAAVSTLLDGYYDIVRRAVGFALASRAAMIMALAVLVARSSRQRRLRGE